MMIARTQAAHFGPEGTAPTMNFRMPATQQTHPSPAMPVASSSSVMLDMPSQASSSRLEPLKAFSSASISPPDSAASPPLQPPSAPARPQRNKPGRKPIQDEPATVSGSRIHSTYTHADCHSLPQKRTAQNRASQRAFRERKQAHIAELEAKVAAYEAERSQGAAAAAESALTKQLQEENAKLKATLREKEEQLRECKDLIAAFEAQSLHSKASSPTLSRPNTALTSATSFTLPPSMSPPELPPIVEDCGFCAGDGRCACRGDGIIDFEGKQDRAAAAPLLSMPIARRQGGIRKAPLWTILAEARSAPALPLP